MAKVSAALIFILPVLFVFVPPEVGGWIIVLWVINFAFWAIILRTMVEDYALKGMGKHWNNRK